jgi:MFS family permease
LEQFSHLPPFPGDNFDAAMAVAIAVGTLYCFLGYRVFRLTLGMTGFLLAGASASGIAAILSDADPVYVAVALLLGGISGAMALIFAYKAGVFCVGTLGGIVAAMHFIPDRTQGWELWAIIGVGLGVGCIALVLERLIMSLATSAIGSWVLVMGLTYFLMGREFAPSPEQPVPAGDNRLYFFAAWLVLALLGAFFQFTAPRAKPQPSPEK